MKTMLISVLAVLALTSCEAIRGYTPMLSIGFEVKGQKVTIGIAPIPTIQRTNPEPVVLPAITIPSK